MKIKKLQKTRLRRKYRVKKKVCGSADRPRLAIFRSNRHIYAQIIDDMSGVTLAACNTLQVAITESLTKTGNMDAATKVGELIAKEAAQVGINRVKFDRNKFKYHGRVKALAEAAREAGLVF